ncbi:MAG: DNA polymerase III subunit gamma/tau [Alphaproteobacteria bacterium]|nr:DNA polymerase III subunit gamma/tau [Alphaproteobacteria bacterium]
MTSKVLARKYRPQIFSDLLGQETLVQTITNAIQQNRLAQAYLLTGIRGVGKTTSARIIAKGLNCIGEDGKGGMTPNPCGKCRHCIDISNDADMDVIEIDAASNTGVDNVREIIEGAKYNPVAARYKIYIIDEVHMLSKAAFNALLKTLEEPPERVKFIFATTEIRKVPVTIVSRCQRFDLRRIDEEPLAKYLQKIATAEKMELPDDAARLLAKAGEGSVRDALSLLDQTLTHLSGKPNLESVRQMLGIANKSSLFQLYNAIVSANTKEAFELVESQYNSGAEPVSIVQDLLGLTYDLTCLKAVPDKKLSESLTVTEEKTLKTLAEGLSVGTLTSLWQMLTQGIEEVKRADFPLLSLEMLIVRLAYLSEIASSPVQLLNELKSAQPVLPQQKAPLKEEASTPEKSIPFNSLTDLAKLAREKGERMLAFHIERMIHLIEIADKKITCSFAPNAPKTLSGELTKFLQNLTGDLWVLDLQKSGGAPTLYEAKEKKEQQVLNNLKQQPDIASILVEFPGAIIEKVKPVVSTPEETEEKDSEEST